MGRAIYKDQFLEILDAYSEKKRFNLENYSYLLHCIRTNYYKKPHKISYRKYLIHVPKQNSFASI